MTWQTFSDGLSIFSENWLPVLATVGIICLVSSPSYILSRNISKDKTFSWQNLGVLVDFFALSLILRLAFLTETFVPPYFDSVEHYRIIQELVRAMEASTTLERLPSLTPSYYHLGFHLLASLLIFGLRANPTDVILVLGQVVLAAIPIPLYFLIRGETQSDTAAFFGTLLAGFGWYMPGFAVNWGKYPALAGLLTLELVLSMAYFIPPNNSDRNRTLGFSLLVLGIVISTLIHSRTLIVIMISFASWIIAGKLSGLSKKFKYLSLGILLAGIVLLGTPVWQEPLLNLALDPYLNDGIWITLGVVMLSPFASTKFSRGFYFSILFIASVFVALFIPIGAWPPGLENQTMLDRPFVEMLLYLPLSILGGLGLAGLLQLLKDVRMFPERTQKYVRIMATIVLLVVASLVMFNGYNFYPSDCCNLVKYDDTIAFDWLDKYLPSDASVLIPGTQMNVLPAGPSENLAGTDGGIWILALTDRKTVLVPFDIDFLSKNTLEMLCQQHLDYVYVGGTDQSFNASQLLAKRDWYERILSLPNAQLYQVTGCVQ